MILRTKIPYKKIVDIFCDNIFIVLEFFFHLLRIFEMHFDLVASKIGAKINFSSKIFVSETKKETFVKPKIF